MVVPCPRRALKRWRSSPAPSPPRGSVPNPETTGLSIPWEEDGHAALHTVIISESPARFGNTRPSGSTLRDTRASIAPRVSPCRRWPSSAPPAATGHTPFRHAACSPSPPLASTLPGRPLHKPFHSPKQDVHFASDTSGRPRTDSCARPGVGTHSRMPHHHPSVQMPRTRALRRSEHTSDGGLIEYPRREMRGTGPAWLDRHQAHTTRD